MTSIMRLTPYLSILVLVIAGLGAGCLSAPVYSPPNGSISIWVEYHRTGGIAGFDDHLIIYENRTATVSRRSFPSENATAIFVISETEATNLNGLFEQARFLELKHLNPAPTPGADYFTYTISYRKYEVQAEDTGIPSSLVPVIQELNQLLVSGCGDDICPIT
ncbi:MAG: hypothetical protein LUQ17_02930 [Methanomicrobiales archaeon]|nr:hypothetical protein [Methanomicrobiales archaeon]